MAANITDLITQATNGSRPSPTTLTGVHTIGQTTMTVAALTGWPTATAVHFIIYTTNTAGAKVAGSQTDWKGVVSGTTLINCVLKAGSDPGYGIGAIVECAPTAAWADDVVAWGTAQHTQLGAHTGVTTDTVVASGNITAANFIQSGGAAANGWTVGLATPNTVTALGNRSYTLTVNSTDLTGIVSNGMRLQLTRTVAAPTKCTSLNGTTQYYSKTSPAGMTQTDSITEYAYIKLTSYAQGGVISRNNGTTDGWKFYVNASGQVILAGARVGDDLVTSYQSVPLNKWVHITASINTTTTTGVITIDGVSVPVSYTNNANTGFLAPTQSLLIGATNGASPTDFFPGKIAQAAAFGAVITPATILTYMSQGLAGTETSLISAYSFNNSINDLNANANNLTANGSAVATATDSPFGNSGVSSTLEYGIITANAFSTNTTLTVQVPEGCAIPTTGGVSAVSYSTQAEPYGLPGLSKFRLSAWDTSGTLTNPQTLLMVQYVIDSPFLDILYTNPGTAGGNYVLSQRGSSREITGRTGSVSTSSSPALGGITWPVGFLGTVSGMSATASDVVSQANQFATISSFSTIIGDTYLTSPSGSGTSKIGFIARGIQ